MQHIGTDVIPMSFFFTSSAHLGTCSCSISGVGSSASPADVDSGTFATGTSVVDSGDTLRGGTSAAPAGVDPRSFAAGTSVVDSGNNLGGGSMGSPAGAGGSTTPKKKAPNPPAAPSNIHERKKSKANGKSASLNQL
jgi:hypothetical protein